MLPKFRSRSSIIKNTERISNILSGGKLTVCGSKLGGLYTFEKCTFNKYYSSSQYQHTGRPVGGNIHSSSNQQRQKNSEAPRINEIPPSTSSVEKSTTIPNSSVVLDHLLNEGENTLEEVKPSEIHPHMSWSSKSEGKMFKIPEELLNKLNGFGALEKQKKSFSFFTSASLLHRKITTELVNVLQRSKDQGTKDGRFLLDGAPGSGRSIALIQAELFALSQPNFIVLPVHNCEGWVNSTSSYGYDEQLKLWVQPDLIKGFLTSVMKTNSDKLKKLKTFESHELLQNECIPAGTDLLSFLHKLIASSNAPKSLEIFLQELNNNTKSNSNMKVLLVIDNISILSVVTKYKDKKNNFLPPKDFYFINLLFKYISGSLTFNRGTVLAATSSQPRVSTPSLDIALGVAHRNPYKSSDETILDSLQSVHILNMEPYTLDESRRMMEYLVSSNVCLEKVDNYLQNHVLSGGNPRKFFDACTRLA
ncbi:37S ribosomal protein S23, mitochondrial [Schizosaccharomyces pombe]|uniref:Small ribosomal subunit protein mS29 n=1 Tax=Schizosaccharomyces pombe (strain 972 / ATCC 24843) TaxID=284812 RepID=RT23_SCHPO|nr:putative mitochondrial ribosomal protein subunit S23 [Schizosaccharomyces pombe]O59677.1 RecName: Full=Small ribosomal subunit protein mS29; AltName: Full=37S ribosomal protein S23, mitochondrial; Flags: Precursor [Schizosaccharomyces pombe 972h-]CAA18392.1 mitochondrial ribosomal protein subunit S23 (predicted) [Schizosaccharomyces pombe]|eukprot:NP_595843.1 putative mitochondrial ribosomal protein subunit S23 [Schizosaccharomyces pombe]